MRRTLRGAQRQGEATAAKKRAETEQMSTQLAGLAKAVYRSGSGDAAPELFGIAQWAQGSEAAKSLAQMAVRSAKGDPALAAIVRERQDLLAEWQKLDALRNAGSRCRQRSAPAMPESGRGAALPPSTPGSPPSTAS